MHACARDWMQDKIVSKTDSEFQQETSCHPLEKDMLPWKHLWIVLNDAELAALFKENRVYWSKHMTNGNEIESLN